jgi:putative transposase
LPHSYNKIWIHAIWSTKNRLPLIPIIHESKVHDLLRQQFIICGCPVRIINGMPDHIHCLFLLNPQKAIADIIKQVKGNVSHTLNQEDEMMDTFGWQTGYAAYSVSESALDKVYLYIRNQKQHHSKKTFQEEYEAFLKLYGFTNDRYHP